MNTTSRRGAIGLALRRTVTVVAMILVLTLSAGIALADNNFENTTADKISGMKHGTRVILTGYVTPQAEDRYSFSDSTGTITILMTEAQWNAAHATPEDLVVLHGKASREGEDMLFKVRRANKAETDTVAGVGEAE